jgi:hypothetical protein
MNGLSSSFQRIFLLAFTVCLAVFGLEAYAHADPTTRAARLTSMQGTVTVNAPGTTENVPAQLNLPLLAGVQLVTGGDGQAEVEFEDGSVARITPNSALSLDNLAIQPGGVFVTNLSLLRGLGYFELRATPQYLYSVNAGGDVMTPVENTTVRVNFDQPPAIFAVLDGTAHVDRQINPNVDAANAGFQTDVRAGESLRGDAANSTQYYLSPGIADDSWDQWNADMDQAAAAESADSTSVRNNYAGDQGYGWSDLDANGAWYHVPGQGSIWQPQLAVDDSGFDPYGYGDWVAYPGVGYVWASGYPWGWTPYRCGTWSYFGGFGWGWAPGAACGGLGWGFFGGGQPVNIGAAPVGYRPIRVPVSGPHPIHPVLPVRTFQPTGPSRPVQYTQRQIAGKTAVAITPNHNSFVPSGGTAGSSLRRDFPVDSTTHAPVLGLASTTPAAVHTTRGLRPASAVPSAAASPAQPPAPAQGSYGGPSRPEPTARPEPSSPAVQRPTPAPAPVQRATPPPAPVQRYSPPPSPPHPTYTPPPPSRPTYTPPPPPPASHPTYSPPPAPSGRPK